MGLEGLTVQEIERMVWHKMDQYIRTPITAETTKNLHAGDYVYLTGTYYMGPSPAREGRPIGSAGPTTASRMDKYAPRLLDLGLKAMIGKGKRSQEVIDAIVRNQAVYFAAVGGAGALLSKCIQKSTLVCYGDLGAEAVLELEVEDFPVVVVIDSQGNNLYEAAAKEYAVG